MDGDGRAVSFIHSLAFTFGAKFTVPGTGIVLNNRLGRGAYLIPGHPERRVAPRRKPLHTLNAWIVTDDAGRLLHVGNTPGGDGQVQWNMQLLSHLLDHGLDPQRGGVGAAVHRVSPARTPTSSASPPNCGSRRRLPEAARDGTAAHAATTSSSSRVLGRGGSAQVISRDERGILTGAADPRQEGVAIGVD